MYLIGNAGSRPSTSMPSPPPRPASPEPSANVTENTRPTLMPSPAAACWLSTDARTRAPKRVRSISQASSAVSTTTTPTRNKR